MVGIVLRAAQGLVDAAWRVTHRADYTQARGAPASAAYDGASTRRRMREWQPRYGSPTVVGASEAPILRARSRDMVKNNPWAGAASRQFESDIVGRGVRPWWADLPKSRRMALKKLWSQWVSEAESAGSMDFYGLQALAMRSMFDSGDCFVRMRERRASDGLAVPLQLELLPSDMVPHHENRALGNGNVVRQGIEFDGLGRIAAYWMHPNHPEDYLVRRGELRNLVRVDARQILHVFVPEEIGQVRGVPGLHAVLRRLRSVDNYDDAELERKGLASSIVGFLRTSDAYEPTAEARPAEGPLGQSQADTWEEPWSIGTLQPLGPGEEVTFPTLPQDGGYERYMATQLRAIAAGGGGLYEHITGDLTGVNYSSARVGLIKHVRIVRAEQQKRVEHQLCRPVLKRWLQQAALARAVPMPGYAREPYPYESPWWVPDGFDWVDPEKQVRALTQEVRSGFTARALVLLSRGLDPDEVDDLNETDAKAMDERKLSYDTDGRRPWTGAKSEGANGGGDGEEGGDGTARQPSGKSADAEAENAA